MSATQQALTDRIGSPFVAAIAAAGGLAILLAVAYLLLMRERGRLVAANARLLEMNDRAEAATRAKSDFLASMSHELRTPLNAVLGFADVLDEQLRGTITDRQKRYLANIHSAGEHLLELINDVLDLSKVEAGRLVLRPQPIALGDLLENVVASAAQLASERGVHFVAPVVPAGTALVDPARVRQALFNLLSNAVKFTPGGGRVVLTVAVHGHSVRFEVTDTGIGIAASQHEKTFGVFERLHEGRSDAPGTGLGLAITKKLVQLHGGSIDFESTEGSGSRFWVDLPDVLVEPAVGPRVLIVEDDSSDAELLVQLARDAGRSVEVVPSAAAALAAIARSAPTAVILDLRLPDRRGEEVLTRLKAESSTARIPVLVVTVEDDDGRARLLGADDHLTKPFDRDRVRAWLLQLDGGVVRARVAG